MGFFAREGSKPHVVITPFPIQSHLNSLMKLGKILHSRGFHITYVNTEYNHKRLLKSRGPKALVGLSDFRFETIPDGLPNNSSHDDSDDATQHLPSLCESTSKNCLIPFTNLLQKLHESAAKGLVPPVTSLISDMAMTFTVKAAQEFKIPVAIYSPINAASYLGIWHGCALHDKGLVPFKGAEESYGYLNTELQCLSGMKNIRVRDLPSFFSTQDPTNEFMINMARNHVKNAQAAQAMIFNTFSELESDALNTLSSIFPPIHTIGPIHLLLSEIQPSHQHLESIGTNLWKEESTCINWLESQKPKSVVYVNFGSVTVMSPEQLHEFAWGLANCKKPFLWIIRPDLVNGGSVILSSEFLDETKDRGFIAGWCEQEKVLNHPSIGGFLTHCGWNSIIESLCSGVPMACWPFYGDQQTNCRYACVEWGIGLEIDNNVKREEVERIVNELMEGEKAKEMRNKVLQWKKMAEEAIIAPGGSSYVNLEKLISQVLIDQNEKCGN